MVFAISGCPIGLSIQVDDVACWYEGDSLGSLPEEVRQRIYAEAGDDFRVVFRQNARMLPMFKKCLDILFDEFSFFPYCFIKSGNCNDL